MLCVQPPTPACNGSSSCCQPGYPSCTQQTQCSTADGSTCCFESGACSSYLTFANCPTIATPVGRSLQQTYNQSGDRFPGAYCDTLVLHTNETADGCVCATAGPGVVHPNPNPLCYPPPGNPSFGHCWGTLLCADPTAPCAQRPQPACSGDGGVSFVGTLCFYTGDGFNFISCGLVSVGRVVWAQ